MMSVTWFETAAWFLGLLILFRAIDRARPRAKRLPLLRQGFFTDLAYWAAIPVTSRLVNGISIAIAIVPFALLVHGSLDEQQVLQGFGPLSRLPLWQQAVLIVIVGDFIGYWSHRWFHGGRLWPFHAVHHSSIDLDWLSSVRLHPLNDVGAKLMATLPVLLMGFAPVAAAGVLPLLTLLGILVHANLDWDWGRFRGVVASPVFHRWHHSDEPAARDKNFAGVFPLWDILFGTYHMPPGQRPARFGTETPVPDGFVGQMLFPFHRPPAE